MIDALLTTAASVGWAQMAAIWSALIVASLIRAFTGFGFALAAMPVLSFFLPPIDAVVLTASLTLGTNLLTVSSFWPVAPKRTLLPILVMALLGTALGAQLLKSFSVEQFQLWVGVGVLAACVSLSLFHPVPRPARAGARELTGLASGLMNGAFAIPGPPIIIYAMATERDHQKSRAMLLTYFMLVAGLALLVFAAAGYLEKHHLSLFVIAMPAMLLGDRLGRLLFARFGAVIYRTIALTVLYAAGLAIVLKAVVA